MLYGDNFTDLPFKTRMRLSFGFFISMSTHLDDMIIIDGISDRLRHHHTNATTRNARRYSGLNSHNSTARTI